MKKLILILYLIIAGWVTEASAQKSAVLQIDTITPMHVSAKNGLKPGVSFYADYYLINTGDTASASGIVFYNHFIVNGTKLPDSTKTTMTASIKPYSIKKDSQHIYTGALLPTSFKEPAAGASVVIVIWPTGNGIHFKFKPRHDTLVYVYTAIESIQEEPSFVKIYPNPAQDIIHLDIQKPDISLRRMEITDMTGKDIIDWTRQDNTIDISHLALGAYILNLHFSDGSSGKYKIIRTQK